MKNLTRFYNDYGHKSKRYADTKKIKYLKIMKGFVEEEIKRVERIRYRLLSIRRR